MIAKFIVITNVKEEKSQYQEASIEPIDLIILTNKIDLNHLHHRNDKSNALFACDGIIRPYLDSVRHSIYTTDDHDVIYCRDHLFFYASPTAPSYTHASQKRISMCGNVLSMSLWNDWQIRYHLLAKINCLQYLEMLHANITIEKFMSLSQMIL